MIIDLNGRNIHGLNLILFFTHPHYMFMKKGNPMQSSKTCPIPYAEFFVVIGLSYIYERPILVSQLSKSGSN